jgi:hypothetical protein
VTRTVLRIACVLALGVIIAAVGVPSSAHARVTPSMVPSAAPAAAIDIPGLFGDENEPDETEADEGGPEGGTSAYTRRAITPSRSSERSVWVSVFFEISPTS